MERGLVFQLLKCVETYNFKKLNALKSWYRYI